MLGNNVVNYQVKKERELCLKHFRIRGRSFKIHNRAIKWVNQFRFNLDVFKPAAENCRLYKLSVILLINNIITSYQMAKSSEQCHHIKYVHATVVSRLIKLLWHYLILLPKLRGRYSRRYT